MSIHSIYIKAADLWFKPVEGCERWKYWATAKERPQKSWEEKVRSYNWIIEHIRRCPNVLETCGGLGLFARLLQKAGKRERHVLVDNDPSACHFLAQSIDCSTVVMSSADDYLLGCLRTAKQGSFDAIVIDFSFHTLLSAEPWQERTLFYTYEMKPEYIVVTDTAIAKYHLNSAAYDKHFDVRTFEEYVQLYAKSGYSVVGWDRFRTRGGGGTHIILKRDA